MIKMIKVYINKKHHYFFYRKIIKMNLRNVGLLDLSNLCVCDFFFTSCPPLESNEQFFFFRQSP